ncbi:MAG: DNA-binding response regulator [Candidatus Riflebacteria bacterium HGW-Riflebacteria-2]|jgi:DNA-binding NarL/FixJ family response regulator|nr:MAG: DNA-binding response regulator [Candidatus Riflebacteria bacterium HGW-Riflebacteria-2]
MKECKIILADDHSLLREGLKAVIEKYPEWKVVGEASNGVDLLAMLKKISCDLVVLDIAMPDMDGLAALKEISKHFPHIKVLMLSMLNDFSHFEKARSLGAAGYMSKEDAGEELCRAIQKILSGKMYIAPSVNNLLAERQLHNMDSVNLQSIEVLTKREKQILAMIARGMTNKEVALDLEISIHTVENHRANLSEKLGSKNVASLVQFAIQKGLI